MLLRAPAHPTLLREFLTPSENGAFPSFHSLKVESRAFCVSFGALRSRLLELDSLPASSFRTMRFASTSRLD